MKIARVAWSDEAGRPRSYWAELREGGLAPVEVPPWAHGGATIERLLPEVPAGMRFLVPTQPTKILCVGRNYPEHARELGNEVPVEPLWFLKPPSALVASEEFIEMPPESERVDFEGELAVVIGKRARRVSVDAALEYAFGFTIVNDVTARDLQRRDGQFTRAKGFDTFCPCGPWIETALALDTCEVMTRVDAEERQRGRPADMIFSVATLLSAASAIMTLEPGDLLVTGTPPGVGPLHPGQRVEVEVTGIGILANPVVAAAAEGVRRA